MHTRGSLARPHVASNAARGVLLVTAGALASACLVSFDGYRPLDSDSGGSMTAGDDGASGNQTGGAKASGGKGGATGGTEQGNAGEPHGDAGDTASGSGGSISGSGGSVAGSGGTVLGGTAGSPSGGSDSGGSGGSAGGDPPNCPVILEGPPLIEIPREGGGFYCMDRTEVTNEQYAAFLASTPSSASQDSACSWNTTFEPDTSTACAASESAKYDPLARPKVPVGCIDWCDAKRYCAWAGKRLCGAIGGGSNPPGSFADASASQWFRACSKSGTQKFPYGNTYNANYCNGADVAGYHPAPVASLPNCTGGYSGLFDMSGNVAEWEDSCSANSGASDNCLIRGGSIDDIDVLTPSLLCHSSTPDDASPSPATAKRNAKNELIGIRCCLDP
jgi:formylglycine-generating enzyme